MDPRDSELAHLEIFQGPSTYRATTRPRIRDVGFCITVAQ
jgi:hypothetical protein